jgi:hypothetical protein
MQTVTVQGLCVFLYITFPLPKSVCASPLDLHARSVVTYNPRSNASNPFFHRLYSSQTPTQRHTLCSPQFVAVCRASYSSIGLDRPLELQQVEVHIISGQLASEGGKVVSHKHQPPLPPRRYPSYSFLLETESTLGL